jgi:hypothetical protein
VCAPGVFHVDKTMYIPMLEYAGRVLVFLRPRRMGKSFIVSMLEYYYDIKHKDQFQELFGHLYIGKEDNVTMEHNSYLVLKLSFSSLNTTTVDKFESSLNDCINEAVKEFWMRYQGFLSFKIDININNAVASLKSLCAVVKESGYAKKVCLIIYFYIFHDL